MVKLQAAHYRLSGDEDEVLITCQQNYIPDYTIIAIYSVDCDDTIIYITISHKAQKLFPWYRINYVNNINVQSLDMHTLGIELEGGPKLFREST